MSFYGNCINFINQFKCFLKKCMYVYIYKYIYIYIYIHTHTHILRFETVKHTYLQTYNASNILLYISFHLIYNFELQINMSAYYITNNIA